MSRILPSTIIITHFIHDIIAKLFWLLLRHSTWPSLSKLTTQIMQASVIIQDRLNVLPCTGSSNSASMKQMILACNPYLAQDEL